MEMTLGSGTRSPASNTSKSIWARLKHAFRTANEIRAMAASAARYYSF